MARSLALLVMALTGFATMYAGPLGINPGDTLNPDGSVSVGLMANSGKPSGSGLTTSIDGITGTNFMQGNNFGNASVLYGGQVSPLLPQTSTVCGANCQQTLFEPTAAPEFNLLGDDSYADRANNTQMWISTSSAAAPGTITIPVGIFGVYSIATMLNTAAGITTGGTVCSNGTTGCANTASYATISFEFNPTDPTGVAAGDVYETLALINGVTQRNILDGYNGASTLSSSYLATDTNGATLTVQTGNVWTGSISTAGTHATSPPVNTTMVLDDQIFPVLAAYQNDYLVSVTITDTGSSGTSNEILSAVTIDPVPEPSTVLMFLTGFGAMGVARLRRKRS